MDQIIDPENARGTGRIAYSDGRYWEIVVGGTTKMQLLNEAVKKMINSFLKEEKMETEFLVSVITFGDKANVHLSPTKASAIKWTDFYADGETSMGAALILAKKMVEDKQIVPSRFYRPTVVLVSDGVPNDNWEQAMQSFVHEGRSSKCFCVAMGIGDVADKTVLNRFIANTPLIAQHGTTKIPNKVFHAHDAESLHEFFQKVTMSVTLRSRSNNPNEIPLIINNSGGDEGYW